MPSSETDFNDELSAIKHWIESQPNLPNEVCKCDVILRRFLISCNFSLDKTKATIELFFSIRSSSPEIFSSRDPFAPEIRQVFNVTDMIPLPNKTKENYKVFIYRLNNLDLFNFVDSVKTFFMLADVRLSEEMDIPDGEIPIFDSTNVSLKFLTKINLSVLKKYMVYTQEALPIRLKQVHIINTPAYIDKLFSIIRPLLKSEVSKQIHFHTPNSESLYKFVPRDLLPDEYGGRAGRLCDIKNHWIQRIEAKRDFFRGNPWAVDESGRPLSGKQDGSNQIKHVEGSFRSLSID